MNIIQRMAWRKTDFLFVGGRRGKFCTKILTNSLFGIVLLKYLLQYSCTIWNQEGPKSKSTNKHNLNQNFSWSLYFEGIFLLHKNKLYTRR